MSVHWLLETGANPNTIDGKNGVFIYKILTNFIFKILCVQLLILLQHVVTPSVSIALVNMGRILVFSIRMETT